MPESPAAIADELDLVWKALSDPTRRAILDFLRDHPRTTTEIVGKFPRMTRFGVMKHIEVLRQAQLVHTREAGRLRLNSLNVVPIRLIYERWVGPFQELWSGELLRMKDLAEEFSRKRKSSRRRKTRIGEARKATANRSAQGEIGNESSRRFHN